MNVQINVARILRAMREKGWGVRRTKTECGVNSETLKKILDGRMPRRLDAWYRLLNGLGISEEEALIVRTFTQTGRKLELVYHRRRVSQIHEDGETGTGGSAA